MAAIRCGRSQRVRGDLQMMFGVDDPDRFRPAPTVCLIGIAVVVGACVAISYLSLPSYSTQYDYVDVSANPAFGSVSVTDANAERPAGSEWTVPGTVTAHAARASGQVLLGAVQVRTDANVLIGSGDLIVRNVMQ